MAKRAVLYVRVSTEEQAKTGFSISEQLGTLRAHAARSDYEIIDECVDEGWSGADPDRPGLRRVMELAQRGEVDVVLAVKRDRFFRSRLYRLLMDRDLEEFGIKLESLNDTGNRIGDGVQDDFAEWEREQIAQRTMAGKIEKARKGKIIAGRLPDYGFDFDETRDYYVVNEERMAIVRRIFGMVGTQGLSVNGVASALDRERVPPPAGKRWRRQFVRSSILDDVYKPHSYNEVVALVSPEVATTLDPQKSYGVWWFNRREAKTVRTPTGPGAYKKSKRYSQKPRTEWVAVPVPASGIPRDLVERARKAVEHNEKCSGAGRRFWELSGGIFRCADCGCALVATTTRKGPKRKLYYYYQCATRRRRGKDACSFTKTLNAGKAEKAVWEAVSEFLLDPVRLRQSLDRLVEEERAHSGLPEKEAKRLLARIAEVERKRREYQDLAVDGLMTREELRGKLEALEHHRRAAEANLVALEGSRERLKALEHSRDTMLEAYEDVAPQALASLDPEGRREVYKALRVTVIALDDGRLRVSGAFREEISVWAEDATSTRTGIYTNPLRFTMLISEHQRPTITLEMAA